MSIKIEKNYIVIKDYLGVDYEIGEERINTALKLVSWIRHLSEKTGWNSEMTIELIDVCAKRFGFSVFDL